MQRWICHGGGGAKLTLDNRLFPFFPNPDFYVSNNNKITTTPMVL